jgi:cytochrome P450
MEVLRFYSVLGVFSRACTQDYKIPGHDFTIPKGMEVHFNVIGIHNDERYGYFN